jgi:signal peptidase I
VQHFLAQAQNEGFRNTIDTLARTPISIIVYIVAACTVIRVILTSVSANVPEHKRTFGYGFARFTNEALDAIVYALIFVFLLIRPFGVQAFTIPTGSMVPTLMINDYIVANKAVYRYSEPKVRDIVVFKPPPWALVGEQTGRDVDYIKRVQGMPGDIVELRQNILYRYKKGETPKPVPDPDKHYTESTGPNQFAEIPESHAEPMDFKLVRYKGEYWPLVIHGNTVNGTSETAEKYKVRDQALMDELRELPPEPIPDGYFLVMGDNRNGSFDSRGWGLVERWRLIGRSEFIWFPFGRWRGTR